MYRSPTSSSAGVRGLQQSGIDSAIAFKKAPASAASTCGCVMCLRDCELHDIQRAVISRICARLLCTRDDLGGADLSDANVSIRGSAMCNRD